MPGAPLLAFTRFHALRRLSLVSAAASNSFVSTSFRLVLFQGSVRLGRRLAFPVWGYCGFAEIMPPAPCGSLFGPSPGLNLPGYYDRC